MRAAISRSPTRVGWLSRERTGAFLRYRGDGISNWRAIRKIETGRSDAGPAIRRNVVAADMHLVVVAGAIRRSRGEPAAVAFLARFATKLPIWRVYTARPCATGYSLVRSDPVAFPPISNRSRATGSSMIELTN